MWKLLKNKKAWKRWLNKNFVAYPETPKEYPCFVMQKICADETTSNYVLSWGDIVVMHRKICEAIMESGE